MLHMQFMAEFNLQVDLGTNLPTFYPKMNVVHCDSESNAVTSWLVLHFERNM